MSLREWEIREAKRAGLAAFLYVSVGVLQAIVGRWWLVAVAGFLVLLYMAVAVMAWAVARAAKPWQEPVLVIS